MGLGVQPGRNWIGWHLHSCGVAVVLLSTVLGWHPAGTVLACRPGKPRGTHPAPVMAAVSTLHPSHNLPPAPIHSPGDPGTVGRPGSLLQWKPWPQRIPPAGAESASVDGELDCTLPPESVKHEDGAARGELHQGGTLTVWHARRDGVVPLNPGQ